jgi:hypothetical protein
MIQGHRGRCEARAVLNLDRSCPWTRPVLLKKGSTGNRALQDFDPVFVGFGSNRNRHRQTSTVADVRYWSKTGKPRKWTVELSLQRLL